MGAEIGLLSVTQIQKLSQSQRHHPNQLLQSHPPPNPSSSSSWIMWNPREPQEDDDSWEVRAFAQDTTSIMGTTWPPRSYTCTFCRREFRSAQALGGHMNVHRRDRARLHHHHQPPPAASVNHNLIPPHQDLGANNGGLCLLYHTPSPDGIGNFSSTSNSATTTLASTLNACGESVSASTLLSIMPYPPNNLVSTSSPAFDFQVERPGFINSSYYCDSNKVEEPSTSYAGNGHEELDLELRLGHRPTPT